MWPVILLILSTPTEAGRLASPDFREREAAHASLKAAGPLALPALLSAGRGDEAEARFRADCLLSPWRERAAEERARSVLYSPWPIAYGKLMGNFELRERLFRIALADGGFVVSEEWPCWWAPAPVIQWYWTPEELERNFESARDALGVQRVGWPFRR